MNVINEQLNLNNPYLINYINNNIINNQLNNQPINQNDLIPLNDYPIVFIQGEYFTAMQLLNQLTNWIDRNKIRTYLKAMIDRDLLALDLDGGVDHQPNYIENINNNFRNVENIIFTDEQNEFIEKVSKFIELCDMDEMRDFIIYMNQRF